jgi:hypothetical protein
LAARRAYPLPTPLAAPLRIKVRTRRLVGDNLSTQETARHPKSDQSSSPAGAFQVEELSLEG